MKSRKMFYWLSAIGVAVLFAVSGVPQAYAGKTVKVGMFPFGPGRMVDQYITDEGIHKKWGAKVGVDFKVSHPRDDFAAFMGKSVQIVALSTMEVGRLVGDEKYDIVMWGKQVDAFIDFYVRGNSQYKAVRELKGKKLVHPGWDTGSSQMGSVLLKEWFGLDMKKDFKVVSAPWPVGLQLLIKGDVEMGINLMAGFSLELVRTNRIRPILATYATEWAKQRNTSHHLSIANFTSWGKWVRGNEQAARAWLGAFSEGMQYATNNRRAWAVRYKKFIKKNATDAHVDFWVKWLKKYTVVYKDAYLTQNFIDEETAFMKMAAKAGFVKPGGLSPKIWKIIRP